MIRFWMATAGTRSRAPINGGAGGHDGVDIMVNTVYRRVRQKNLLKGYAMTTLTTTLAANPADETIDFGPLAVRFLLTADNSNATVAVFELVVRAAERLPAPAHSHDHYEETIYGLEGVLTWTVDGRPIAVGPGQALCI